ncbi:MAG: 1-(5-phosphoribosyl)-5-[(5-phosphoribosylamino)methylideneamino]imidazole-4-carboxamide isomerase [Candidatus Bathyarchaeia archaeon]|jgi:phosphoribosylformimino-5-aminoimidazole carboxamide ribotide isomerase
MQLIPAIDLMNGKIVRLSRGDPKTAKVYDQFGGPVETAKRWRDEGAGKLHIIDLDATFGTGNNHDAISEIAANIALPIQVGGGIRSFETAAILFKTGISQVILGALAFSDQSAIGKIQKRFGAESVIVALDNKDGRIMVEGWKTATALNVKEALEKFTKLGVKTFLITSIAQDGMLSGPDLKTLSEAVQFQNAKIIAAGGIGSINDLIALKHIGVDGAVIGKALYEGRFTLKEAINKIGA